MALIAFWLCRRGVIHRRGDGRKDALLAGKHRNEHVADDRCRNDSECRYLAQDATEASDALNASEESPSVLHAGGKRNSALGAAARTMRGATQRNAARPSAHQL